MSRHALSLGSLLLIASLAAPESAEAYCRMTTSPRSPTVSEPCIFPSAATDPPEQYLSWQSPCTGITFSLEAPSEDLTLAQVQSVFQRSMMTWNGVRCDGAAPGFQMALLEESSTCVDPFYRSSGGNVNTVMFVSDWADRRYDTRAFAVTTVWHRKSTGEILDVDMEINERQGPYDICPSGGCRENNAVDLENVITHELGHYLGLAHSEVNDATMYLSAEREETHKRDLNSDDVAGVCAVYPPGSFAQECDHNPQGGLRLDCEPGGCSVARAGLVDSEPRLAGLAILLLVTIVASRRRSTQSRVSRKSNRSTPHRPNRGPMKRCRS